MTLPTSRRGNYILCGTFVGKSKYGRRRNLIKRLHQWLQTKPALLYFAWDTENAVRGYALFCGIDSVNSERTNGKDGKK